jgi:RHS repeat-associated protein
VDGYTTTFDAFNRPVEIQSAAGYTQILYLPTGQKFAMMNGQSVQKYFVPVGGGIQAVYNSSGFQYYRHSDWQGSSRFAGTSSGTVYYDAAYAPFGENYAEMGTTDRSYTGQTQDTTPGLYDFLFRQQSQSQGRWLVPDPAGLAAVDITNPQTWNRYAYLRNNPLNAVDPKGLYLCSSGDDGGDPLCDGADDGGGGGGEDPQVQPDPITLPVPNPPDFSDLTPTVVGPPVSIAVDFSSSYYYFGPNLFDSSLGTSAQAFVYPEQVVDANGNPLTSGTLTEYVNVLQGNLPIQTPTLSASPSFNDYIGLSSGPYGLFSLNDTSVVTQQTFSFTSNGVTYPVTTVINQYSSSQAGVLTTGYPVVVAKRTRGIQRRLWRHWR